MNPITNVLDPQHSLLGPVWFIAWSKLAWPITFLDTTCDAFGSRPGYVPELGIGGLTLANENEHRLSAPTWLTRGDYC